MDLYSRQLYVLGKDSLSSMKNCRVLIIGTLTPFVEIMKNLVLMGIGEITIADNRIITNDDLETNYYLNESDLNKDFVNIVGFRMQKLNPTIKINKYSKNNFNDVFLKSFTFVIILNRDYNLSLKLHALNIPHIVTKTSGFSGFIFVDYINFISYNPNGEKIKQGLILNICKDNNNTQIETVSNHDLFCGNCIKIKNEEFKIVKVKLNEIIFLTKLCIIINKCPHRTLILLLRQIVISI